ncbi:4-hydroxyphenylacetate 3-hydroxylase family protein [Shouchella patagoniensis]|uniref:4-hydroxyphenylacetate 3-hydroxylase family protein n=1 Tax=Shouchella patagoniensis TaxID=228576 RepID=UPI0009952160|nr:4-hydroxyphenylacetate 3-hydroxylase N-terminal domain-containing protein [Shouchella patagoniensis]
MAMLTGAAYLKRIGKLQSEIWMDGERVSESYVKHPFFKPVLQTKARLYDMVHEEKYASILQSESKETNFSFEIPRSMSDLVKRRKATQVWASETLGVLGRSPDYVNTMIAVLAGAKAFFAEAGIEYGENIEQIYKNAIKNDLTFTHTFVNPSISRKPFYPDGQGQEQPVAAKIIEENEQGIIVDGARLLATQGGVTDELLVIPSAAFIDSDYLFGCTIPSDTKGLSFVNRPSYKQLNRYDYPLSSQFEEGDAIVVFDHVLIPWERVFLYRNEWQMNDLFVKTGVEAFLLFQATNRQISKTEWLLGVAQSLVNTLDIEKHQHVQGKIAEIIIVLEAMRGFVYSAEAQAKLNDYEIMVPALSPLKAAASYYQANYSRLVEIVQLLGASHFIAAPSEKDFASPIAVQLERFVRGEYTSAKEKFRLIQLARDLTITEFGTRQLLYERYFYGDPVRVLSSLNQLFHDEKSEYAKRVAAFLQSTAALED